VIFGTAEDGALFQIAGDEGVHRRAASQRRLARGKVQSPARLLGIVAAHAPLRQNRHAISGGRSSAEDEQRQKRDHAEL
jgi:hypothetical protein